MIADSNSHIKIDNLYIFQTYLDNILGIWYFPSVLQIN